MSYLHWKVSRQLHSEELPKQSLLFALFSQAGPQELDSLELLYPADYKEWQKRSQSADGKLPEDQKTESQNLKELGF